VNCQAQYNRVRSDQSVSRRATLTRETTQAATTKMIEGNQPMAHHVTDAASRALNCGDHVGQIPWRMALPSTYLRFLPITLASYSWHEEISIWLSLGAFAPVLPGNERRSSTMRRSDALYATVASGRPRALPRPYAVSRAPIRQQSADRAHLSIPQPDQPPSLDLTTWSRSNLHGSDCMARPQLGLCNDPSRLRLRFGRCSTRKTPCVRR